MIDILTMGEMLVEIMRPEENMPLDQKGVFCGPFPSGAPAICIDAAARLGCRTAIISGIGRDDFGKCILTRLEKDGVDTSLVLKSTKRSTGCAFVTYFSDGSRKFIFHMRNTPAVEAKAPAMEQLPDASYLHIMGCSLMADYDFAREIIKVMHALLSRGAKISFDPNIRKELLGDPAVWEIIDEVLENTSIFLPGTEELLMISGEQTIEDAVRKCFTYPRLDLLILKNGAEGSRIYTKDKMEEIGVYPVIQKDATGAGDCFDGAFLAGMVQGKSPVDAACMGAAAGALNAAAFGPMEGDIRPETVQFMIDGRIGPC